MTSTAGLSIVMAAQMKILNKLVEREFSAFNPVHFHRSSNFTNNGMMSAGETCYFNGSQADSPSDRLTDRITEWIYVSRYILPIVGGFMSSAWFGCKRVLQLGGAVMLLSTVLMSVSVFLGLMCQDSPMVIITWLLLPVFFGLVQPSVLMAMFCWHRRSRLCTVAATIYYAVAAFGELVSSPFLQFGCVSVLGHSFTLVFVAVSLAFLTLTAFLPEVREYPFELPTKSRMLKYFQIFSALILFLTFLIDSRSQVYLSEINYFMNETADAVAYPWLAPNGIKCVTIDVLALPMIIAAVKSRRKLAVQPRILAGILLKCSVDVCLIIVTLVGLSSPAATVAVYSLMSVLDGAAELLVMVAAYDLGCSLLPDSSQCLILGVMFTVWGLANCVSHGLLGINQMESMNTTLDRDRRSSSTT